MKTILSIFALAFCVGIGIPAHAGAQGSGMPPEPVETNVELQIYDIQYWKTDDVAVVVGAKNGEDAGYFEVNVTTHQSRFIAKLPPHKYQPDPLISPDHRQALGLEGVYHGARNWLLSDLRSGVSRHVDFPLQHHSDLWNKSSKSWYLSSWKDGSFALAICDTRADVAPSILSLHQSGQFLFLRSILAKGDLIATITAYSPTEYLAECRIHLSKGAASCTKLNLPIPASETGIRRYVTVSPDGRTAVMAFERETNQPHGRCLLPLDLAETADYPPEWLVFYRCDLRTGYTRPIGYIAWNPTPEQEFEQQLAFSPSGRYFSFYGFYESKFFRVPLEENEDTSDNW